jgi:hypothetical protein
MPHVKVNRSPVNYPAPGDDTPKYFLSFPEYFFAYRPAGEDAAASAAVGCEPDDEFSR